MILPLAKVPFIMGVLGVIWIVAALLLGLIILIQKGRGGGLGAALGGAGAGSLMGTKTGDFLTWVTIAFTVIFLVLGVVMSRFYRPVGLEQLQTEQPAVQVDESVAPEALDTAADQAEQAPAEDIAVEDGDQPVEQTAQEDQKQSEANEAQTPQQPEQN